MSAKRATIAFISILALGICVRLIGIDKVLVLDELRTVAMSRLTIAELPKAILTEAYPPALFYSLHYWLKVSVSVVWIRLFFIIFGAGSVIAAYHLGREAYGKRFGMVSMFIMALMPMQIWVSQYVRGIAPALFFILLSMVFFVRILKSRSSNISLLDTGCYVLSSVGALYFFYFSYFALGLQTIVFIMARRKHLRQIIQWSLAILAIAVAFAPWVNGFVTQMRNADVFLNYSTVSSPGLRYFGLPVGIYLRSLGGALGLDQGFYVHAAIAKDIGPLTKHLLALMVFICVPALTYLLLRMYSFIRRRETAASAIPLNAIFAASILFAATPVMVTMVLNMAVQTPLAPRYYAVANVFTVFGYASMYMVARNRLVRSCIAILFCIISIVRIADFSQTVIDYRSAAQYIKGHFEQSDGLVFIEGERAYTFYAGMPQRAILTRSYVMPFESGKDNSPQVLVDRNALRHLTDGYRSLWVYNNGEKTTGVVSYVLASLEDIGFHRIVQKDYKNLSVYRYMRR